MRGECVACEGRIGRICAGDVEEELGDGVLEVGSPVVRLELSSMV